MASLDVVDSALLVPPDIPIRGGWRTDAAVVLDRELLVLAGMESRCRLVLARLARRLVEVRAWRPLGFVRLSDYAGERLGVSPRSLEDDAHVMRALDRLPRLRSALESGAASWTQARLIVKVATPDTEEHLMAKALGVPTRELEDIVRRIARERDSASRRLACTTDAQEAVPADEATCAADIAPVDVVAPEDTDARPTNVAQIHAHVRSDDDATQVAVAATAAPADEEPAIRWGTTISRSGRRIWRAASETASRMAGAPVSPAEVLELVAAEAVSGAPRAPAGESAKWMPSEDDQARRVLDLQRSDEARGRRAVLAFLAETGVCEGFAWLAPTTREAGPAARLDDLLSDVEHTDAFELDRRLREARLAMQRIDYQMAALLCVGVDRRLFREIGFATVKLYVESRLGCSARKVWSLIAIERESWRSCPLLRESWRDGRLSYLAACALLPVMGERHGAAWIRRAREVTLRRLVDEVAWALDHGDYTAAFERPAPPPLDTDVRVDGVGDIAEDEVRTRAHGDGGDAGLGPGGAVRLDFHVPLSVAVLVETALWQVRVGTEPRWRTFERMVALALLEWSAAPRHRDPVFERDGWRCSVPGCSSRRNLHDHHVLYRSHGGSNARDNRTTVCAAHHLHGLHAGIVKARGSAPFGIVWELGCRRDAQPLMRLLGDRFVVEERAA